MAPEPFAAIFFVGLDTSGKPKIFMIGSKAPSIQFNWSHICVSGDLLIRNFAKTQVNLPNIRLLMGHAFVYAHIVLHVPGAENDDHRLAALLVQHLYH